MTGWLSWWLKQKPEAAPLSAREELRALKLRRRALLDSRSAFLAYGFDVGEDERALKTLDRRILALQLRRGSKGGAPPHS
jgi:hypothetical protein